MISSAEFEIECLEKDKEDIFYNDDESEISDKDYIHKDGGWGWIVVITASLNIGIIISSASSYSLINNRMIDVYSDVNNHVFFAAWIGSAHHGLKFFMFLFSAFFVSFFNPKIIGILGGFISAVGLLGTVFISNMKLYFLTYVLIFATGQAFLFSASFAIIPHYFSKKLALASGILTSLATLISMISQYLTSLFLNYFGLPGAFCFYLGLNLFGAILCFTYESQLPKKEENIEKNRFDRIKETLGIQVFKKPKFVIWCVASFFGMYGLVITFLNMAHHSITKFPKFNPVIINLVFTIMSVITAFISGKMGDITKFNRIHYHTFALFLFGIFEITLPFAQSFYVFIVNIGILGAIVGVWLSYRVIIATDLVESSKYANQALGYYHAFMAPTAIAGPVVSGKLYEIFKNYDLAFYIGGMSCIASSIILTMFVLVPDLKKFMKRKYNKLLFRIHLNRLRLIGLKLNYSF